MPLETVVPAQHNPCDFEHVIVTRDTSTPTTHPGTISIKVPTPVSGFSTGEGDSYILQFNTRNYWSNREAVLHEALKVDKQDYDEAKKLQHPTAINPTPRTQNLHHEPTEEMIRQATPCDSVEPNPTTWPNPTTLKPLLLANPSMDHCEPILEMAPNWTTLREDWRRGQPTVEFHGGEMVKPLGKRWIRHILLWYNMEGEGRWRTADMWNSAGKNGNHVPLPRIDHIWNRPNYLFDEERDPGPDHEPRAPPTNSDDLNTLCTSMNNNPLTRMIKFLQRPIHFPSSMPGNRLYPPKFDHVSVVDPWDNLSDNRVDDPTGNPKARRIIFMVKDHRREVWELPERRGYVETCRGKPTWQCRFDGIF